MRGALTFLTLMMVFLTAEADSQTAGYVDCYGGSNADGEYWLLLDRSGQPLEDGDWAYAAWTGPDGKIDPPDARGYPTGDDVKLPVSAERIEYSSFLLVVATWEKDYRDEAGQERHPWDGETIYCRIFDDPRESVGPETHYSDSQLHELEWKMGDVFFCNFPGDPGEGRTGTPLKDATARPSLSLSLTEVGLRQIPPHLLQPVMELQYAVPTDAEVSLRIHDQAGRSVAVLVEANQEAGLYSQRWSAEGWPAGIYLASLKVGNEMVRKRILLLK